MKSLKVKEVIRLLLNDGWYLDRQRGSIDSSDILIKKGQ
jgi:predicted RNA binding protein YcfA (HicA-like mRNA interferase family)